MMSSRPLLCPSALSLISFFPLEKFFLSKAVLRLRNWGSRKFSILPDSIETRFLNSEWPVLVQIPLEDAIYF